MTNELMKILNRLFDLSETEQPADDVVRARLAALFAASETEADAAGIAPETWAAYFEGQLDPEKRALVQRQIAASPALLREAVSIAELLEEVAANPAKVPADLAAEVAGISRQAFSTGNPGLQRSLAATSLQGVLGSGVRGALEVVLGQGRQACEILLNTASELIMPASGAWSFSAAPALVTRASSGGPAIVEGVRDADAASMTVTADRFEGSRRIEIVIRDIPPEKAPIVLVSAEGGEQPPTRLDPSVATDPATGAVRLIYEFDDLPAGRYVVLICDPEKSSSD